MQQESGAHRRGAKKYRRTAVLRFSLVGQRYCGKDHCSRAVTLNRRGKGKCGCKNAGGRGEAPSGCEGLLLPHYWSCGRRWRVSLPLPLVVFSDEFHTNARIRIGADVDTSNVNVILRIRRVPMPIARPVEALVLHRWTHQGTCLSIPADLAVRGGMSGCYARHRNQRNSSSGPTK